ncbi:MAG: hypothetical protein Q9162_005246 [Coniocarpon cinnabarinum]
MANLSNASNVNITGTTGSFAWIPQDPTHYAPLPVLSISDVNDPGVTTTGPCLFLLITSASNFNATPPFALLRDPKDTNETKSASSTSSSSPAPLPLPPSEHHGLSEGAKAGIVIGSLVGGLLVLLLFGYSVWRRKNNQDRHNRDIETHNITGLPFTHQSSPFSSLKNLLHSSNAAAKAEAAAATSASASMTSCAPPTATCVATNRPSMTEQSRARFDDTSTNALPTGTSSRDEKRNSREDLTELRQSRTRDDAGAGVSNLSESDGSSGGFASRVPALRGRVNTGLLTRGGPKTGDGG